MKNFIITYNFTEGTEADWHAEINKFIAAVEADPELQGNISYTCYKSTKGPEYYHMVTVADENIPKILGERDFFKHYTEKTEWVGGGNVQVTPIEQIASTK